MKYGWPIGAARARIALALCAAAHSSFRPIATALLTLVLIGCATSDPALLRRIELTKGVSVKAKPCCEALTSLTTRAALLTVSKTEFSPETEHFDLGMGLAPIQVFKLDATTRAIEAHAPLQLLGFAYGGDGKARHLDVKTSFLDSFGAVVTGAEARRVVRYLGSGYRALFYYVNIPQGASYVVFTTDPRRNGMQDTSPMEGMPASVFPIGAVPVFLPAPATSSYTLTNYSTVQFQALSSPVDLAATQQ